MFWYVSSIAISSLNNTYGRVNFKTLKLIQLQFSFSWNTILLVEEERVSDRYSMLPYENFPLAFALLDIKVVIQHKSREFLRNS